MKKILYFLFLTFISLQVLAQAPLQFNYQAVLRDAGGSVMESNNVAVTINILQGSATGTEVFSETHNTTTNEFGLISLQVGSISSLNAVSWDADSYFLEIEVDGTLMGVTQLLSVPFAIHAATAATADYNNLDNLPALFDGDYQNLENKPELNIDEWDAAHSWGDHADAGYILEEEDPSFTQHFDFSSATEGDVLRYDGNKWVATPDNYVPLSHFDALLEYLQNSGNVQLVDFSLSAQVVQPDELINFSDNSLISGTSWDWDFGDGNTSQMQNPSHEYTETGSYDVSLTVSDGKITMTKILQDAITVNPPAVNLIKNGQFDDDSEWTIINFYECSNEVGLVTIADGYATWSETEAGPWKHMGIYQELELEAGTYNVDLWVEYSGIDGIWGEVYVGQTQPTHCTDEGGTDYGDNRVLVALNAWDCNTEYSGYAVANACNVPDEGVNGQFTIDVAGTYYFVFKIGGASYSPDGIKVDNITLFKQ